VTTTTIKTSGLTLAATCTGMPSVILPSFDGSGLLASGTAGLGAFRVEVLRDERPMSASVAAEAAVNHGYVYAAGAGDHKAAKAAQQQSEQHMHSMWAYRGPGPWKERT
jgi:hypothetical protein